MTDKLNNEKLNLELSKSNVIKIVIVLSVIGVLILVFAGVFNSPEAIYVDRFNNIQTSKIKSPEIIQLEKDVRNNPNNKDLLLKLANTLNDNGFYQQAIVKYGDYLKINPGNADVIVDQGVCYFNLKQYEKAVEIFKNALKYDSTHQIAHFNLGIVNLNLGKKDEAVKWFKKVIELYPNSEFSKRAKEFVK